MTRWSAPTMECPLKRVVVAACGMLPLQCYETAEPHRNLYGHYGKSNVGRRSVGRKQCNGRGGRKSVFSGGCDSQGIFQGERSVLGVSVEGDCQLLRR